jgi:hypothetical protein
VVSNDRVVPLSNKKRKIMKKLFIIMLIMVFGAVSAQKQTKTDSVRRAEERQLNKPVMPPEKTVAKPIDTSTTIEERKVKNTTDQDQHKPKVKTIPGAPEPDKNKTTKPDGTVNPSGTIRPGKQK